MKVTDKNYLDTQGFSVFLYDSTYHAVFVDQKNTAMEMILHGQRIATNGDVRLMPTPEQWDLVATLKGRRADKANTRLTADLAFPTFDFSYTLEVAAEPRQWHSTISIVHTHHCLRRPIGLPLLCANGSNNYLPESRKSNATEQSSRRRHLKVRTMRCSGFVIFGRKAMNSFAFSHPEFCKKEASMFMPTSASDWFCPAGHKRELLGVEGSRRLRCTDCEGYDGDLLTEFDHEFLTHAGVRIQAD
jgi:hypothetical protein